jgi:hypothetical protein
MPGVQLPKVPLATDLQSLINAVNGLRGALQNIVGPGLPFLGQPAPNFNRQVFFADMPNWTETYRVTEQKRIYHRDAAGNDPDGGKQDKSTYVDVIRINKIVFQYLYDDPYGEEFDWQYKR